MIIRKVSSTPKNAYDYGLSSEGNTLSLIGGNVSNLGAHPFTSNTSLFNYGV